MLAKGGKVVVTGLIGGGYSTAVAMFPLKAMTIEGTQTGTLGRSARIDRPGAREEYRRRRRSPSGRWRRRRQTLDDLRAGKIVGRVVLTA